MAQVDYTTKYPGQDSGVETFDGPEVLTHGLPTTADPTGTTSWTSPPRSRASSPRSRRTPPRASHEDIEARMRPWLAAVARAGGLPDGSLAEAFTVLRTA
jgi:hypothetical protein